MGLEYSKKIETGDDRFSLGYNSELFRYEVVLHFRNDEIIFIRLSEVVMYASKCGVFLCNITSTYIASFAMDLNIGYGKKSKTIKFEIE